MRAVCLLSRCWPLRAAPCLVAAASAALALNTQAQHTRNSAHKNVNNNLPNPHPTPFADTHTHTHLLPQPLCVPARPDDAALRRRHQVGGQRALAALVLLALGGERGDAARHLLAEAQADLFCRVCLV